MEMEYNDLMQHTVALHIGKLTLDKIAAETQLHMARQENAALKTQVTNLSEQANAPKTE